jgi:hypothetical protein
MRSTLALILGLICLLLAACPETEPTPPPAPAAIGAATDSSSTAPGGAASGASVTEGSTGDRSGAGGKTNPNRLVEGIAFDTLRGMAPLAAVTVTFTPTSGSAVTAVTTAEGRWFIELNPGPYLLTVGDSNTLFAPDGTSSSPPGVQIISSLPASVTLASDGVLTCGSVVVAEPLHTCTYEGPER